MNYREVAEIIKKTGYKRILVTGPQRSGTTITAKIIAEELKFEYIDENAIHVDNFDQLFKIYQKRKFVLQAPGLSAYAHMIPGAVIFMRRPIEEIIESQERINWSDQRELKKYFQDKGIVSEIKYEYWDKWQKNKNNMFEIDYYSIKDHPLYISKELRSNFKPRQTNVFL